MSAQFKTHVYVLCMILYIACLKLCRSRGYHVRIYILLYVVPARGTMAEIHVGTCMCRHFEMVVSIIDSSAHCLISCLYLLILKHMK